MNINNDSTIIRSANRYDLFEHPSGGVMKAISVGFSWPAFLVEYLWAWSQRMVSLGFVLLIAAIFISIIIGQLLSKGSEINLILVTLIVCAWKYWLGSSAHSWQKKFLTDKGWKLSASNISEVELSNYYERLDTFFDPKSINHLNLIIGAIIYTIFIVGIIYFILPKFGF